MTGAYVSVVLFCPVCPCIGAGARGWVVDTAGHGGWFHPAGVGLLTNCRVVFGHLTPLATNVVN